jgi:hypothetical protein
MSTGPTRPCFVRGASIPTLLVHDANKRGRGHGRRGGGGGVALAALPGLQVSFPLAGTPVPHHLAQEAQSRKIKVDVAFADCIGSLALPTCTHRNMHDVLFAKDPGLMSVRKVVWTNNWRPPVVVNEIILIFNLLQSAAVAALASDDEDHRA